MNNSASFLLSLRETAKACPDAKLRREMRDCADSMGAVIHALYNEPTEDMLRALQCLYSYSIRLLFLASDLTPTPPTGGKQTLPITQLAA